jgi:peptidoglycan/xylan/chitin deacetylase (PgdA/CDA1 family)
MERIRKLSCFIVITLLVAVAFGKNPALYAQDNSRPVKVFLWFDTEDYILPEADDALLRITEFLEKEGIRGTFKIVGEKARVLEKRGRADIIDSLKNHEIGYHSDLHSAQPSPAMYLSDLDWSDGVKEFARREYQGLLDVRRITGQKVYCYGQPGGSWGPQVFEALRNWGIRVYLDSNDIIDISKAPFWYSGVLTLCSLEHEMRVELKEKKDLDNAKIRFSASREKILAGNEPGVVSIFYHPCEFVHAQFWDGVNFSRGANPAREDWVNPPMKSKSDIETGFDNFEGFVRYIKSFPDVEFVTARQALEIFPDQSALADFSRRDLDMMAGRVIREGVKYQVTGDISLTAAEIFQLLCRYADAQLKSADAAGPWQLADQTIGGPVSSFTQQKPVISNINQYARTLGDVIDYISVHSRIPDSIWLGGQQVSPESFLIATANLLAEGTAGLEKTREIEFKPEELKTRSNVKENPTWDWVIFPEDFTAPAMVERGRQQTWSLKPAVSPEDSRKR